MIMKTGRELIADDWDRFDGLTSDQIICLLTIIQTKSKAALLCLLGRACFKCFKEFGWFSGLSLFVWVLPL